MSTNQVIIDQFKEHTTFTDKKFLHQDLNKNIPTPVDYTIIDPDAMKQRLKEITKLSDKEFDLLSTKGIIAGGSVSNALNDTGHLKMDIDVYFDNFTDLHEVYQEIGFGDVFVYKGGSKYASEGGLIENTEDIIPNIVQDVVDAVPDECMFGDSDDDDSDSDNTTTPNEQLIKQAVEKLASTNIVAPFIEELVNCQKIINKYKNCYNSVFTTYKNGVEFQLIMHKNSTPVDIISLFDMAHVRCCFHNNTFYRTLDHIQAVQTKLVHLNKYRHYKDTRLNKLILKGFDIDFEKEIPCIVAKKHHVQTYNQGFNAINQITLINKTIKQIMTEFVETECPHGIINDVIEDYEMALLKQCRALPKGCVKKIYTSFNSSDENYMTNLTDLYKFHTDRYETYRDITIKHIANDIMQLMFLKYYKNINKSFFNSFSMKTKLMINPRLFEASPDNIYKKHFENNTGVYKGPMKMFTNNKKMIVPNNLYDDVNNLITQFAYDPTTKNLYDELDERERPQRNQYEIRDNAFPGEIITINGVQMRVHGYQYAFVFDPVREIRVYHDIDYPGMCSFDESFVLNLDDSD